jgi:tRNA A37 threonylcarbamoyladenosine dehydratase
MPLDHTRHSGIFSLEGKMATLIGCGGIGALTAIALGKMGLSGLRVIDDDVVNNVNIATQFHKVSDIGLPKVDAVGINVGVFADTWIHKECARVTPDYDLTDWIVISAVDSIQARKDIWEAVKKSKPMWYIDARMASEKVQMFAVNMRDVKSVESYDVLMKVTREEDIPDEPCTSKATIFCSCMAAGHVCKAVRQIATGLSPKFMVVHDIVGDTFMVM